MVEPHVEQLTPLQNAVYLLKQAQARLAAYERAQAEPIAVIGMSCRFPGGESPEAYWRLLHDGVDAVREVPADRWNIDDYYDPDPTVPAKMNTRCGGFLSQVDQFDAEFFGISPREAVRVDPQQRLLLEVAWEALEDAGVPAADIAQTRAGVYVGVIGSDYGLLQSQHPEDLDVFSGTGISHSILANRLSYILNLSGPSVTLDTACSSSLVTIHLACQSLRRREADLALAGGVNLILSPEMTLVLCKAHMLAPDGRCKTYDAAANGYVRGEGCGLVVLKRLSDALAAEDRILAVVRGSAVNHDGRSNGLSAPNGLAQEAVIRAALADARVAPTAINYIEAHGTGTRLGDPIEIEALRSVLTAGRSRTEPLLVGSVKTNIGHLESAAGIAGLIKLVLMLQHSQIPPHLHLKTINPLLKLDEAPLEIPTTLRPWERSAKPRLAGVSSFGFGGTNAHVILEEPPAPVRREVGADRPRHVLTLSARSAPALAALAGRFAEQLAAEPTADLGDIAYTANTGRVHFQHRAAIVADSRAELSAGLSRLADESSAATVYQGLVETDRPPRIAFLFTGQGAQYAEMGCGLYRTQPVFRDALDRCAELLRTHLDRPFLSLLEPSAGGLLDQTGYTQPALFAIEYALATLWRSWGVEPTAVLGHSVGEFAAACIAGVFSLEDGLRLIATRARLMQSLPAGGLMAAVFASVARVQEVLETASDRVAIAALNGPENTVISGDEAAVREMLIQFAAQGITAKTLKTSHAFHSHHMDPILDALRQAAASVTCAAPGLDLIANLTGELATARTYADPTYWSRHARSPVQFAAGMQALAARGCELFLEIGPSPHLVGMGRHCLAEGDHLWLASLRPGRADWQTMLESLAQLYVRGARIDWTAFDQGISRRKVALPHYPFQRRRYWASSLAIPSGRQPGPQGPVLHPLLGCRVNAAVNEQIFESQVSAHRPALLADHKVQGRVLMPGAAFLEMALAASAVAHGQPWQVCRASVLEPLLLDKTPRTVQTILTPAGADAASFRIVSCVTAPDAEPAFVTHAAGRLEKPSETAGGSCELAAVRAQFTVAPRDQAWRTEALRKSGLEPGPTFSWISLHWQQDREVLAEMRAPRDSERAGEFQVHPGLLDCGFQLLGAALPGAGTGIDAYVPTSVERLQLFQRPQGPTWFRVQLTALEANFATGNAQLVDPAGGILVQIEGIRLRRVPRDWLARLVAEPLPNWCYELAWLPQPLSAAPVSPPAGEPGRWLIFDSEQPLGTALAERLEMKSHLCTRVPPQATAAVRTRAVREFLAGDPASCRGIVYLSNLDLAGPPTPDALSAANQYGWGGVLDVVQALSTTGQAKLPRLWLVTRGAQAAGEPPCALALTQSPIWGLGRVIAAEHPELNCTRVDLDPQAAEDADQLAEELCLGEDEDQIVYRGGERRVARLRHLARQGAGTLELPRGSAYRLEITERGQLDNVTLRALARPQPGPGQVEIQVQATGLNFRDVLNVLNLYPGDPGPLGGECAGVVSAVGPGVTHLQPGDPVVALAPASFASHALTLAEFVVRRPDTLDAEAAATIPICFLTAELALHRVGRLQPGERVLIHAGSGGVGLAAIQLARQIGAEIFATAGSPRKREYLQSLGIQHVFDSRTLDFADQILAATAGAGVDLVVNSLTGDAIRASLSILRAGGRFLELGKTDLWDQRRVDAFKPGLQFQALALDHLMATEPQVVGQLMREVVPQFATQQLEPLPRRVFPVRQMVDALRHMARAEHIGKVVIQAVAASHTGEQAGALREDGTYLITGGLGGLGLKLARWLADRGARHLVLLGRSAATDEARRELESLAASGVRVTVRRCDISQRADVATLLDSLRQELPPLRGVFHLAGVLDDGVLREQTRERFERVLASKVHGAWHLHELTRRDPLDLFVLFSSAAALLGSPGQGNYAAANAFLDALAHQRRSEGLPGLSVNWGSWAEVGMAARLQDTEGRRWSSAGVGYIEPARGLETLEQLLAENRIQAGVLPIEWAKFCERIPAGSEPAWLRELARAARQATPSAAAGPPALLEELRSVTPAERLETAVRHIRQQAARVLAMDDANLPDPRRTLNELGFDSLTAVELCNRIGRSIGQHLNPALLYDYPTLESLAGYVLRELLHLEFGTASAAATGSPEAEPDPDAVRGQAVAEVEAMSEADMDALVAEQLSRLQSSVLDREQIANVPAS